MYHGRYCIVVGIVACIVVGIVACIVVGIVLW